MFYLEWVKMYVCVYVSYFNLVQFLSLPIYIILFIFYYDKEKML